MSPSPFGSPRDLTGVLPVAQHTPCRSNARPYTCLQRAGGGWPALPLQKELRENLAEKELRAGGQPCVKDEPVCAHGSRASGGHTGPPGTTGRKSRNSTTFSKYCIDTEYKSYSVTANHGRHACQGSIVCSQINRHKILL